MPKLMPEAERATSHHASGDVRTKWLSVLMAVTMPHFTLSFGAGGLAVLMPLLQRDLRLSPVDIGLLAGARFAGLLLFSIPAAAIVGTIGLRRAISLLQVFFGLTLVGLAGATDRNGAIAAVGAGSSFLAASNPATTTAVVLRFPARHRAQAMNTKQVGVPLGNLLAAVLFPIAAAMIGWRGAFLVAAVVSVSAAGVSWILYGPAVDSQLASTSRWGPGLRVLLRSSAVRLTTIMHGLLMVGQITMLAYFVVYLVSRHVSLGAAAAYLVLMQLAGTAGRLLWGLATDYGFGGRRRATLITVILIAALGAAALAIVPADPSPWLLVPMSILVGLGLMSWAGMIELVRAELVASSATAAATGVGYTFASIGAVVGPPLFGLVVQSNGFVVAWVALAVVLLLAAAFGAGLTEPATLQAQSV